MIEQTDALQPFAAISDHRDIPEAVDAEDAAARLVRHEHASLSLRVGCRHRDEFEVERILVVKDQQTILAVDDGMVDLVLHTLGAGPDQPGLGGDVALQIDQILLTGDARADADDEVSTAAGDPGAQPEALVRFVEELHVVLDRRAQTVQPERVGTPGVVAGRVDDAGAVGREESSAGARNLIGERGARHQIAHADRVELVAFVIRCPQQSGGVIRHVERAE